MDSILAEGIGAFIAAGLGAAVLVAVAVLVMRRRLENGWQASQDQRNLLYDRLKLQGALVRRFIDTVSHRLAKEGDSLEILGRRQTKVAAGRTPVEKAAALIELNRDLERMIALADADPGLAGLSDYEKLRNDIEQVLADIGRIAAAYNEQAALYNRLASGVFGGMFGALPAEPFDSGARKTTRAG